MAHIIELPTRTDTRGSLTVLEKVLPFAIARLYWIYDLNDAPRGRHRHKQTWQGMICLQGECEILIKKYNDEKKFILNKPHEVLVLEPEDWHEMRHFKNNCILLLVASHHYDPTDYINEPLIHTRTSLDLGEAPSE